MCRRFIIVSRRFKAVSRRFIRVCRRFREGRNPTPIWFYYILLKYTLLINRKRLALRIKPSINSFYPGFISIDLVLQIALM